MPARFHLECLLLVMLLSPALVSAELPTPGAGEYAADCAVCHGASGRGDGPMHDKLTRRPSDLTVLGRNNGGSFPETLVYQIIDGRRTVAFHGTREMPVWGERFGSAGDSEALIQTRIDHLIRHLESLQREGIEE